MSDSLRILGIDPGSRVTGWGVLECSGGRLETIEWGAVSLRSSDPFEQRLLAVGQGLVEVIRRFDPDHVAVEDLFHARSISTAIKLGQVRGAVVLTVSEAGLPIHAYPPATVKKAVSGYGAAGKEQVAGMVARLLGLGKPPRPADAADALAVALCHAHRNGLATARGDTGSGEGRAIRHPVRG